MIKLIVYDLDGTLADTRLDIARSANWALLQIGLPALSDEEVAQCVGIGVQHLMREIIRRSSGDAQAENEAVVKKAVSIFRAHYDEHLLDETRLYAGVEQTLDFFDQKRVLQAVLTNKSEGFSRKILSGLGVGRYFFSVMGGDSPLPKKPEPDSLLALMKLAKTGPAGTVFVGDSVIDVETGKRAGVRTIVIPNGFQNREEIEPSRPDVILENFETLREFLCL